jgi:lipid-binding SYLF domain-containing protein
MRMNLTRRGLMGGLAAMAPVLPGLAAASSSHRQIDRDAAAALRRLLAGNRGARALNEKAVAVLVFPKIVKAGLLVGGAYGEGALRQAGRTLGHYNSASASIGFQAGVQWFGYALFFMNAGALKYLDQSQGFEIGSGPSVVVVDQGMAGEINSTTLTHDVYAFIFNQKGLMAGIDIEGTKITRIQ